MTGNIFDEWGSIKGIPVQENPGDGYPRLFDEDFYTPDPLDAGVHLPTFLNFGLSGVASGVTGAASITTDDATASAAGSVAVAGAAAVSTGAATASGAGALPITGTASNTTGAATLSAAGNLTGSINGSAALTAGAATDTAAGALAIAGTATPSTAPATLSAAGALPIVGTASNTTGATTLAAAGGTPTSFSTVEVAAGEGYTDVSPKQIVRTASNYAYAILVNCDSYPGDGTSNYLMVKKGNQTGLPSSFIEKDTANRPTGGIAQWGAAIDSTGLIHMIYAVRSTAGGNITDIRYITFNTSTDTYGTSVSLDNTVNFSEDGGSQGHESVSIAIDASDKPHAVYLANVGGVRRMRYINKVSGSWSAAVTVDTQTLTGNQKIWHPNLVFDVNGRILFQYHIGTFNDTADAQMWIRTRETNGTFNAAVAVSAANALLTGIDNSASMIVTADNRYHVTWMNGSTTPANKYIRYAYSDDGGSSWTRNDPGSGLQATHNPSLGPNGKGGIRIYGHGTPDASNHGINLYYFEGAGGPATWSSWTLWVTNSSLDSSVNVRWSQYHHNKPGTIDALYWNDNYPNFAFYGGEIVIQATAANTTGAATLAATGTNAGSSITGSASLTTGAATVSAAGALPIAGTSTPTTGAATLSAAGVESITGAGSPSTAASTLSAAGALAIAGTTTSALAAATLSAAGALPIVGSGSFTLGAATVSAAGALPIVGSESSTLAAATLSAAGALPIVGSVGLTTGAATVSGAGTTIGGLNGSANLTTGAASLSAAGALPIAGTSTSTTGAATLSAAGLNTAGRVGSAALTTGAATLSATGVETVSGSGSISLAAASLSAAGALPISGTTAKTTSPATLSANGSVGNPPITGSAALNTAPATSTGTGSVSITAVAVVTTGGITTVASGSVAIVGVGGITTLPATATGIGTSVEDGTIYVNFYGADVDPRSPVVTVMPYNIGVSPMNSPTDYGGGVAVAQLTQTISPTLDAATDGGGIVVLAGALPPGLTINPTTGVISGTPTKAGTYIFTVRATDSTDPSASGERTYTIVVS